MMVILAANVGFSSISAFIMGSIIAETTQAEHIEHVKPVKTICSGIFVVGWYAYPNTLYTHAWPVAILTLIVIFGQSISSTIGA
jgi:CPA2 family monovalent cation:H+ antiporter-2